MNWKRLIVSFGIGFIFDIMIIVPVSEHIPGIIVLLVGFVNQYAGFKIYDDLGLDNGN